MNAIHLRKFVAPEIIFGNGARHLVGEYCQKFQVKRPFLVSDAGVIRAGWTGEVLENMEEKGLTVTVFDSLSPNPKSLEVMEGARLYREAGCDAIVCVGGGSPMDCAKGIGIVISNGAHILDFEGVDQIRNPLPPMIFIPTTAGTASDVSQFCIINNETEKVKIAIISKIVIPDLALVDPETTMTMDAYLTACTGMDAMVHAIEAYVSTANSKLTDIHALEAIRLVAKYLPQVHESPGDTVIREKVMFASLEAGLAFSNAVLGAVHAMAHSLGGFLDLPHGECNSLLLEHVINFNFSSVPERYTAIAKALGIELKGKTSKQIQRELFQFIHDLRVGLGVSKTLGQVNVRNQDIPDLSRKALNDACLITNPRTANQRDIEVLYEEAL